MSRFTHMSLTEFKESAAVDTFILRILLTPAPKKGEKRYPCNCKDGGDLHDGLHGGGEPGGRGLCAKCGTIVKPWEFPKGHCDPIRSPVIKEFA